MLIFRLYHAAGLTGFALFASLFTFISSAVMFFIPFVYDK